MKSPMMLTKEQEYIFESIFYKNKEKINKVFAKVLGIIAIAFLCFTLFSFYIENYFGAGWCRNIFILSSVFTLVMSILLYFIKINANLKAIILNIVLIFICAVLFFLYPTIISLFVFPILISVMYFDKKIVIFNAIAVLIMFTTALQLNVWLDKVSIEFHNLHIYENAFTYQVAFDVFIYFFMPKFVAICLTTVIGVFASVNGRKIVLKQAISSSKISVLQSTISTASEIQKRVLPKSNFLSINKEIEIYSLMKSARETAGDFYDYFYIDDNNLVVLIADVSDKGLPAAMFMMLAKNTIKLCVQNIKGLKSALEKANAILKADEGDMFTTLWIASINTLNGKVNYINAGHVYPFVKHKDGSITEIVNEPNLFIGMFDNVNYNENSFSLERGDTLVLYTDGSTDAMNSKDVAFGKENFIKNIAGDCASKICNNLFNSIENFVGTAEQFDDITIMGIQRLEAKSKPSKELHLNTKDENISQVIDSVNEYILGVSTEKARKDIDIILDEICANICDYSMSNEYIVKFEKKDENFIMQFIDSGKKFNPLQQDIDTSPLEIGGKGILLVKNLADKIDYIREDNKNILTVTKDLSKDYE